jgi:hypothetical protein
VRDESANAVVYLTTTGTPGWLGTCTVRMRVLGLDGSLITEGSQSHSCGASTYSGPHPEGVRAAAAWALEESVMGVRRAMQSAGAMGASAPGGTRDTTAGQANDSASSGTVSADTRAPRTSPRHSTPTRPPQHRECITACPRADRDEHGCCVSH